MSVPFSEFFGVDAQELMALAEGGISLVRRPRCHDGFLFREFELRN